MKNRSKGLAILQGKCPACREGNLFPTSMVSYRKLTSINKHCPTCNANLYPEPEFYYGAMYISYAFSVALALVTMFFVVIISKDAALWKVALVVLGVNLIMMPMMLRYSKVLYLYGVGKIKYKN